MLQEDELFQLSYLTGCYCLEEILVSSIYLVAFTSEILFLVDNTTERNTPITVLSFSVDGNLRILNKTLS